MERVVIPDFTTRWVRPNANAWDNSGGTFGRTSPGSCLKPERK